MPSNPETLEHINLKPNAPLGCPFKNTIVPGPMAGQITYKTVPCNREHCALWWEQAGRCSLAMISPALLDIHAAICKLATWVGRTPSP